MSGNYRPTREDFYPGESRCTSLRDCAKFDDARSYTNLETGWGRVCKDWASKGLNRRAIRRQKREETP
jgi:hypothetical protein